MTTIESHPGTTVEPTFALTALASRLNAMTPANRLQITGTIVEVTESRFAVIGLSRFVRLHDCVYIAGRHGWHRAEVAAIDDRMAFVIPYDKQLDAGVGSPVRVGGPLTLAPHASWTGRVINAFGEALDDAGHLQVGSTAVALDRFPPAALQRSFSDRATKTGVTAIDVFAPLCIGQRIGIFSGSGVGKSTLLAMLAQSASATIVIVALVGERGREVREFIERTLHHARSKVIAVIATGDDSTMTRRLAPRTAMAIAEYFRDAGHDVLLIMDSLTRFAHAQREYALSAGEPPVARGYPPSVFRELANLLERAGPGEMGSGSITLFATVLVDGDDHNDPIADAVRGIVDGHIILDRAIAADGRWPAIDILQSISRLADKVWSPEQVQIVGHAKQLIARYEQTKDLRALGDYRPGADSVLDSAIATVPRVYEALCQRPSDGPTADPFGRLAIAMSSAMNGLRKLPHAPPSRTSLATSAN